MQFISFEQAKKLYESQYKGIWKNKEDAIKSIKKSGDLKITGHPHYKYLCWHIMYGFYLK